LFRSWLQQAPWNIAYRIPMRRSRLVVELRCVFVPALTSLHHIEGKLRAPFFDDSAARREAVGWVCGLQNPAGLTKQPVTCAERPFSADPSVVSPIERLIDKDSLRRAFFNALRD